MEVFDRFDEKRLVLVEFSKYSFSRIFLELETHIEITIMSRQVLLISGLYYSNSPQEW